MMNPQGPASTSLPALSTEKTRQLYGVSISSASQGGVSKTASVRPAKRRAVPSNRHTSVQAASSSVAPSQSLSSPSHSSATARITSWHAPHWWLAQ